MSRTKKNNIVLGLLCSMVLIMVVGYAAFATQLNINGTSNISSNWDVKITNIQSKNVIGGASNDITPWYTDLTATFSVNLVSPGDSITYDVTVTNAGTINAELDKITISNSNNPAIIFSSSGLTEGSILTAGNSEILTIVVTYDPSVTSQPSSNFGNITVTLDYVQEGTGTGGEAPLGPGGEMKSVVMGLWDSCPINRNNIQTITIKTNLQAPNNVAQTCDLGVETGTVMAWADSSDNLIIGADGLTYAPENSTYLFHGFAHVTEINGIENLDTSNVTNMTGMFYNNFSLTTLDLSSWDTSNVTNMSMMFQGMSFLSSLDLSRWDTTNVTDMFSMFMDLQSLTMLDFRNATFGSVIDSFVMFVNAKTGATIYTKDNTTKTWLQNVYPSGNYIIP